ncbi:hypothetical protein EIP91_012430 [Steccherinum ochraceum]|uniref:BTB domain-containing protein n=1 Tax=Steccherinum ochraceum TaxID=92696 RepID=A0A4R0RMZ2_9APHY|nr:hypothetical protein EIP91_012430 [Steccherinum ochraceum]
MSQARASASSATGSGPSNAPGSEDGPRDAPAPFNKPSANLILRTSDGIDFRVQQVILIEASTFFADMLSLPAAMPGRRRRTREANDQEFRDGIPVVLVTETSQTMNILLRFCYPVANPKLSTPTEVCEALDASKKYLLEDIEDELQGNFHRISQEQPLPMYALAVIGGWEDEVRIAARGSLGFAFTPTSFVPEMEHMDTAAYVRLQQYHRECVEVVQRAILLEDPRDVPSTMSAKWACSCFSSTDFAWFTCKESHGRRPPTEKVRIWLPNGLRQVGNADQWVPRILHKIQDNAQKGLRMDSLFPPELVDEAISVGATYTCTVCRMNIARDVRRFKSQMESIIGTIINGSISGQGTSHSAGTVLEAQAPFNKPLANLIIRTSDGVDFRVQQALLREASTVFEDLLSVSPAPPGESTSHAGAQDPRESPEGVRVMEVAETSRTMDNLLRFIYPVPTPHITTAASICETLDASRKYKIEHAEKDLKEQFGRYAEKDPLSTFALAAKRGWGDEMGVAAKGSLKVTLEPAAFIEEMRHMPTGAYVRLQRYHRACVQAAESIVLRDAPASPNGPRYICTCAQYIWFLCDSTHPGRPVIHNAKREKIHVHHRGLNFERTVDKWFITILEDLRLRVRGPRRRPLVDDEMKDRAGTYGVAACCNACGKHVSADFRQFAINLEKAVDEAINAVVF